MRHELMSACVLTALHITSWVTRRNKAEIERELLCAGEVAGVAEHAEVTRVEQTWVQQSLQRLYEQ